MIFRRPAYYFGDDLHMISRRAAYYLVMVWRWFAYYFPAICWLFGDEWDHCTSDIKDPLLVHVDAFRHGSYDYQTMEELKYKYSKEPSDEKQKLDRASRTNIIRAKLVKPTIHWIRKALYARAKKISHREKKKRGKKFFLPVSIFLERLKKPLLMQ